MSEQTHETAPSLDEFQDGDRIEIQFDPPLRDPDLGKLSKVSGTLQAIVSRHYLHADDHRNGWGMAPCLDLNGSHIVSVRLIEDVLAAKERKRAAARGELVFPSLPACATELQDQLNDLALLIANEPDRSFRGRQRQLEAQFDDIADLVALAKLKRNYILLRAVLGEDFHPYYTRDDRVYRNETVRPLPADFEFDRARRIDRQIRLGQSIRIFGEAERETRNIASALRGLGYDVRRPHPNAQELLVRFSEGRAQADVMVFPTPNGFWQCKVRPAENKSKHRAARKLLKAPVIEKLSRDLSATC
jgi:hypothetical protein